MFEDMLPCKTTLTVNAIFVKAATPRIKTPLTNTGTQTLLVFALSLSLNS